MSHQLVIALIVGSTAGIFLLDWLTPIGLVVGVLYGCPVYLSGWLPERRSTLIVAWIATALTLASFFLSPPGGLFYLSVGNHTIAIASIWLTAGLTLMHKRARALIHAQQRALEDANANLEQRVIERTEELRRTMAEKERFASELRVASEIQRSILPRTFPPFPEREDFAIYAETIPAREMGGDFYDFFLVEAERLGFVIADVSDKGVPAAIFMAVSRSLLRATALQGTGSRRRWIERAGCSAIRGCATACGGRPPIPLPRSFRARSRRCVGFPPAPPSPTISRPWPSATAGSANRDGVPQGPLKRAARTARA
jgi:hypothetical protein